MSENEAVFDYGEYVGSDSQGQSELLELSRLADRQAAAESEVKRLMAQLSLAQDNLNDISTRLIPEAMERLGMTEFKTVTGIRIIVKENIVASITNEKKPEAFKWFREAGYGAMLKRVVSLEFGKGEDDQAEKAYEKLSEEYQLVDDKTTIHPSTLRAFVRDCLENGVEIPIELLGVHRYRVAVID